MWEGLSLLQASPVKERSGRAQIVASLKETISGLKAAGDVEGRLKSQVIALHGQITAAQHAQVLPHLPCSSSLLPVFFWKLYRKPCSLISGLCPRQSPAKQAREYFCWEHHEAGMTTHEST